MPMEGRVAPAPRARRHIARDLIPAGRPALAHTRVTYFTRNVVLWGYCTDGARKCVGLPMFDLLLVLAFGFAIGFGVRDMISRRRRREASRRYDRIGK
jgi:hypothetical protein